MNPGQRAIQSPTQTAYLSRRCSLLILTVTLVSAAPALRGEDFREDRIEETEGRGLWIRSAPSGAAVSINGYDGGRTPLIIETLPPGDYELRLSKEGYRERRLLVRVRPESRLTVSLVLEEERGQVLLRILRAPGSPPEESLPLRPLVTVEGVPFPGPVLDLPAGWRTITVRAFGWEDSGAAVYIRAGALESLDIALKPAAFRLSGAGALRKRFNPGNSGSLGTTELVFEVSAPGQGRIEIFSPQGQEVFSAELGPFSTWSQRFLWQGRDTAGKPLPDGTYTVRISAGPLLVPDRAPPVRIAEVPVEINASLVIRPAGLWGAKPGLLFAPVPEALPGSSFQIEAALLGGRPPGLAAPWKGLPFAAALRASPLEGLELAAALNLLPKTGAALGWGLGASVKGVLRRSGEGVPLGLAAGLSWAYTGEEPLSPFGMNGGAELFFPVSWDLSRRFSLVFTPSALWEGPRGYPEKPVPRLILAGGLRFEGSGLSAALSLRQDYGFRRDRPGPGTCILGGEIRLFPPPSSLVFTLAGGAWFRDRELGAFGGLGAGLIY
jgi:hypothetical protein